ncbi:MAG TPA: hypothetical protein VLH08_06760, partial [Acidobacteriota bacterium]|nr:hypothetical protein [Acidobacteriota bacterium]
MSRKSILFVLLVLTILYRGSFFFEIFSRNSVYRGIQWSVKDRTLVARNVERTDPFGRPTAAGWAGIKEGDRIVEIVDVQGNSFPIHSLDDLGNALRKIRGTQSASFIVHRPDANGKLERIPLTVKQRLSGEHDVEASLLTILWTSLLPLVAITTAFFIGFSKPEDNHAFLASLLFLAFSAIITIDIYLLPPGLRELSRLYETTCVVFLTYLFMRFFLLFPHASWIERKFPWLKTVFLYVTLILLGIRLYSDFSLHNSFDRYTRFQELINPIGPLLNGVWFAMLGIGVVSLLLNTLRPQTLDERRRMMILLIGVAIGIVLPGILVLYAFNTNSKSILLISAIALFTAAFPAAFAYIVVRHRVLGIQLLVRRGLQYLLISHAFWILETILVFLALYFLVLPVLMRLLPWTPPFVLTILIGALTLLTYYAIRRINQPIMNAVDRRFFRQAYDAREILTDLSRAVGRFAASPAQLLELVTDRISRALHPDPVAVFLKGYDIAEDEEGKTRLFPMKEDRYFCVWIQKATQSVASSDYAFPPNSFTSQQLEKLEEPHALEVYLDDPDSWAHALMKDDSNEAKMIHER